MKIKLRFNLPVDPKHGLVAGRVCDVARVDDRRTRGGVQWFVIGDANEEVGVLRDEADVVQQEVQASE